ncbi:MAG: PAS domain-containing protein, partial [Acidimicrobiales bacterium]
MTGADLVVGIDDLPDAVIVLDETAVLRYANPAAESLFGWSAPDRIGSSALESVHPDDVEMALASLTTVFGKDVGTPLELRVMTATGWRLVELIGSSAAVDGRSMIVLTLRDLTARRRWEVGHDDEALFRTLLQHAAAVTILVSDAGLVRATSAALTRDLGHDPEAVAGRPLAELVGPERVVGVAVDVPRQRGGVVPQFGGRLHHPARLGDRLAALQHFEPG